MPSFAVVVSRRNRRMETSIENQTVRTWWGRCMRSPKGLRKGPEHAIRYPLRHPRLLVGLGLYLLRHRGGDVRIEDTAPPIRRGDGVRALTQVRCGEDGLSMVQVDESDAPRSILEGDSPRGRSR